MILKTRFLLSMLVASSLLTGCGGIQDDDIQKQYVETVRKLGIVPVYPPREEFQVGDVFAVSFGANKEGKVINVNDSARVWVADFPEIVKAAEDFMRSRIVFQAKPTSSDATALTPDLYGTSLTRRGEIAVETLPVSAFPTITADAGFTSGLGIARVLQSIGVGGGARTQVRLEFENVRSYWVEPVKLNQTTIRKKLVSDILIPNQLQNLVDPIPNPILNTLVQAEKVERLSGRELSETRCTTAVVVTRVYLARKITYTFYNGQIIAAGIRRAEDGSTVSAIPAPTRITVNIDNKTGEPTTVGSVDDELASLRTQIDALATGDSQGAGLNFESWNALGITLSKEYPRPVAIGYEGFSFPVDLKENPTVLETEFKGYNACS